MNFKVFGLILEDVMQKVTEDMQKAGFDIDSITMRVELMQITLNEKLSRAEVGIIKGKIERWLEDNKQLFEKLYKVKLDKFLIVEEV